MSSDNETDDDAVMSDLLKIGKECSVKLLNKDDIDDDIVEDTDKSTTKRCWISSDEDDDKPLTERQPKRRCIAKNNTETHNSGTPNKMRYKGLTDEEQDQQVKDKTHIKQNGKKMRRRSRRQEKETGKKDELEIDEAPTRRENRKKQIKDEEVTEMEINGKGEEQMNINGHTQNTRNSRTRARRGDRRQKATAR